MSDTAVTWPCLVSCWAGGGPLQLHSPHVMHPATCCASQPLPTQPGPGGPCRRAPWVTWQGLLGAAARQHLCAGRPLQPPRRGCQHQARAGTGGCFLPCAGLGGLPASVVEAGSQAARRWHRGGAPGPSGSAAAHSRRSAAVSGRLPRALTARKDGESLVSFRA